jgi:hypothetical protein
MKKNLNSPNSLGSAQGELPQSKVVFWVLDQLRLLTERRKPLEEKRKMSLIRVCIKKGFHRG